MSLVSHLSPTLQFRPAVRAAQPSDAPYSLGARLLIWTGLTACSWGAIVGVVVAARVLIGA